MPETPVPPLFASLKAMSGLQALDLRLLDLVSRRKAAEAEAARSLSGIDQIQAALDAAKAAQKAASQKRAALELEARAAETKLQRLTQQQAEVASQAAYQAMMHELESAKAALSELETLVLGAMESEEQAAGEAKRLEEGKPRVVAVANEGAAELRAQAEALKAEHDEWAKGRKALTEAVGRDLSTYERLHKHRPGKALAAVREGQCGNCHMKVPPHLESQARAMRVLSFCENCGSILADGASF